MRKNPTKTSGAKILRPLSREEHRLITGGLAFSFIQQAMDDPTPPVEPAG